DRERAGSLSYFRRPFTDRFLRPSWGFPVGGPSLGSFHLGSNSVFPSRRWRWQWRLGRCSSFTPSRSCLRHSFRSAAFSQARTAPILGPAEESTASLLAPPSRTRVLSREHVVVRFNLCFSTSLLMARPTSFRRLVAASGSAIPLRESADYCQLIPK